MKSNDLKTRAKQQLDRWKAESRMPTVEELIILQQYAIKEYSSACDHLLYTFLKDDK